MFAAPSTAAALEKQFVRYDFVSGTQQSERVNFVDEKYNDYASVGLDGVIFAGAESGVIIIEGKDEDVSDQVNTLKNDSRLTNVQSVDTTHPSSSTLSNLRSHTELDPRGFADVSKSNHDTRVYIRAEFASGVDRKETVDEYFDQMASESIGGTLVEGPITGMCPTVLEGYGPDVADWISKMKHDERFTSVTVLQTTTGTTPVYPNLWAHSSEDVRSTTK